jgi:hypothetical protein
MEPDRDNQDMRNMPPKTDGDVEEDNDDMVWNNDWDDDDDIATARALETQQILIPRRDPDDEAIEDEIRANLSSKITSSLHAYKVAGVALIVALISFTINTVFDRFIVGSDP